MDRQARFTPIERVEELMFRWCFREEPEHYGWIFIETHEADRASIASAQSFLKANKGSVVNIIGVNVEDQQLSAGIVAKNLLELV